MRKWASRSPGTAQAVRGFRHFRPPFRSGVRMLAQTRAVASDAMYGAWRERPADRGGDGVPQEGTQPMAAKLRLTREGFGIELRRGRFDVLVDGESVGSIETVEKSLDPGDHTLRIRAGRYSSRELSFGAVDGDTVNFRCHGAMVWPRYVASIFKTRPRDLVAEPVADTQTAVLRLGGCDGRWALLLSLRSDRWSTVLISIAWCCRRWREGDLDRDAALG